MKKILLLLALLSAAGAAARAQAYVLTPVVPEESRQDTLKKNAPLTNELTDSGVSLTNDFSGSVGLTNSGSLLRRRSGKWYLGLGGGLDFTRSGMYINVCPDISYRCNNAVFLGSQFSYTFDRGRSSVGVAPYARLHIVPLGKFITLYVTAYAPCSLSQDRLQLGFSAKPGIGIRVFPGIYFMGSFGTLGYSYIRTGDSIASGWGSNFSTDTIDLGFFFNL